MSSSGIIPGVRVGSSAIVVLFCDRLRSVLTALWVVKSVTIGLGAVYFTFLIFQEKEPRPRVVKWGGKIWGYTFAESTVREEDWWTLSISEYSAARGTTGAKLLSAMTTAIGCLDIVSAPIFRDLCLASNLSQAFLIVAGICCIVIGQMESSAMLPDEPTSIQRMKLCYGLLHTLAAVGFIAFTTTAVITSNLDWPAVWVAVAGCGLFFLFCVLQSLTGAYILSASKCLLPQKSEHRNPGHPRWGSCHRWLSEHPSLTLMGRLSLLLELGAFLLVAFSSTLGAILVTAQGGPCKICQELIDEYD